MPTEDELNNQQEETQQIEQQQVENTDDQRQEETQQQQRSDTPKDPLESMLDRHMEETDRVPRDRRQATGDQTQRRTQQERDNRQQRQDQRDVSQRARQEDGRFAAGNALPQATRRYGDLFYADTRGDIYDAKGKLVAKQGYARSVFHSLLPYIETATTEAAALRTRVQNYERATEIAKQNGLTLDDYGAAMQLMVQWKKDRVGTINTLLRIAEQSGTDVTAIRQASGMDPAALRATVTELLTEHLKPFQPFIENLQAQRERDEQQAQMTDRYNAFISEFPDVIPHQGAIANLMRDHNMTEREAYFALRTVAAHHQLDWTKDIAQQLNDKAAKTTGNRPQRTPNGDRGLPNMSGGRNDSGRHVTSTSTPRGGGNGEESWDSIIKSTFRDHGIQIE